ncbi:Indoleamine 2,3-dioxygenase [Schizophyllum fasciatum]
MAFFDVSAFLAWAFLAVLSCYRRNLVPRPLSDFDVSESTGFMPPRPLPKLQGRYGLWEAALRDAADSVSLGSDEAEEATQKRESGSTWRKAIERLPALDVQELEGDLGYLQRAHYVLAYLIHYYVHSIPEHNVKRGARILIPRSLAAPMTTVSRHLRMAPVLTYADTILWNVEKINEQGPMTMDNLRTETLFSGTEDESAFYMSQVRCELRGAELLSVMADIANLDRTRARDAETIVRVSGALRRVTGDIEELTEIMKSIRPTCDPHTFYWQIRPWFIGSSDEHPWIFEGADAGAELLGPSGGQSSLMHAIDVFLDIDHELRSARRPAPNAQNRSADTGFMRRMRRYMPGPHRDFLEQLEQAPVRVRGLAEEMPALRDPYDEAVAALKRLRDSHMRIAVLYVVSAGRTLPAGCPLSAMARAMERKRPDGAGATGTGGSEVSALLKAGRDATRRAMLKSV